MPSRAASTACAGERRRAAPRSVFVAGSGHRVGCAPGTSTASQEAVYMSKWLRALVLGLTVSAVLALAAPTGAQGPDNVDVQGVESLLAQVARAEDPQQTIDSLPNEARRAIANALIPPAQQGRIAIEIEFAGDFGPFTAAASNPCAPHKVTANYYSGSIHVWSYWSKTVWCWNGQVITSKPDFSRKGSVHSNPPNETWSFLGHTKYKTTGGQGQWEFTDHTKGEFEVCGEFDLGDLGTVTICFIDDIGIKKFQYGSGKASSIIDW